MSGLEICTSLPLYLVAMIIFMLPFSLVGMVVVLNWLVK